MPLPLTPTPGTAGSSRGGAITGSAIAAITNQNLVRAAALNLPAAPGKTKTDALNLLRTLIGAFEPYWSASLGRYAVGRHGTNVGTMAIGAATMTWRPSGLETYWLQALWQTSSPTVYFCNDANGDIIKSTTAPTVASTVNADHTWSIAAGARATVEWADGAPVFTLVNDTEANANILSALLTCQVEGLDLTDLNIPPAVVLSRIATLWSYLTAADAAWNDTTLDWKTRLQTHAVTGTDSFHPANAKWVQEALLWGIENAAACGLTAQNVADAKNVLSLYRRNNPWSSALQPFDQDWWAVRVAWLNYKQEIPGTDWVGKIRIHLNRALDTLYKQNQHGDHLYRYAADHNAATPTVTTYSTLAASWKPGDAIIYLQAGRGAAFPTPGSGSVPATLALQFLDREDTITFTGVSGDTLTGVAGGLYSHPSGAAVQLSGAALDGVTIGHAPKLYYHRLQIADLLWFLDDMLAEFPDLLSATQLDRARSVAQQELGFVSGDASFHANKDYRDYQCVEKLPLALGAIVRNPQLWLSGDKTTSSDTARLAKFYIDRWLETFEARDRDLVYYSEPGYAAWAPATVYAVGDIRRSANTKGVAFRCSTAGTSDAAEPTWNTTVGQTTAEAPDTLVWTTISGFAYDPDDAMPPVGLYGFAGSLRHADQTTKLHDIAEQLYNLSVLIRTPEIWSTWSATPLCKVGKSKNGLIRLAGKDYSVDFAFVTQGAAASLNTCPQGVGPGMMGVQDGKGRVLTTASAKCGTSPSNNWYQQHQWRIGNGTNFYSSSNGTTKPDPSAWYVSDANGKLSSGALPDDYDLSTSQECSSVAEVFSTRIVKTEHATAPVDHADGTTGCMYQCYVRGFAFGFELEEHFTVNTDSTTNTEVRGAVPLWGEGACELVVTDEATPEFIYNPATSNDKLASSDTYVLEKYHHYRQNDGGGAPVTGLQWFHVAGNNGAGTLPSSTVKTPANSYFQTIANSGGTWNRDATNTPCVTRSIVMRLVAAAVRTLKTGAAEIWVRRLFLTTDGSRAQAIENQAFVTFWEAYKTAAPLLWQGFASGRQLYGSLDNQTAQAAWHNWRFVPATGNIQAKIYSPVNATITPSATGTHALSATSLTAGASVTITVRNAATGADVGAQTATASVSGVATYSIALTGGTAYTVTID